MKFRRTLWIAAIFAATGAAWLSLNRPIAEPAWEGRISGFAYAPMRPGQRPGSGRYPTEAEIAADLDIIAARGDSVRTYSLEGSLASIPRLAAARRLDVTVGLWLEQNLAANRAQLNAVHKLVTEQPGIHRIIAGNETILTERLNIARLIRYLDDLRASLDVPVSTAEPWHIWLANPELAEHVDFLTVHLLPYWEGVGAATGVELVNQRMRALRLAFPEKPIVIGEVGWPSNGRRRGAADASHAEAELFLRRFLTQADRFGYEYFLMEAFDQPWKRADEGAVGAHWGLFDADREAKYAFAAPLVPIPQWRVLALLAAALGAAAFWLLTIDSRRIRWPGLMLLAATTGAVATIGMLSLHEYLQQYWTIGSAIAAAVLLTGIVGMVVMICIEAHEWAEADFGRRIRALSSPVPTRWPKVSVHVPAYAEPPAMLIDTLNALSHLDYPNFEVVVVDNNTPHESLWRPVEAHCRRLGQRFRFFHVAPLSGYKAGALNFALRQTTDDAEIIAVIDSDYRVAPDWLSSLVGEFESPSVALVQAPQDYRDHLSRPFKRLCEAEYRGFFRIGMVTRNERNAIIQHGTMTMIRASVLREVGGWAEWTVTEDTELGLRILEHGYDAVYTPQSFGKGLTPDTFRDYRAQRYRWSLGAMQILRHHGRQLLGLQRSRLSRGQRFHFLTGWTGWLGDGLNLAFNLIAIGWSTLMILAPLEFLPPVASFSWFVLALFLFKLIKMAWLYSRQVKASAGETALAVVAGLSLVYIVGRAMLAGLRNREARFVRTPKLVRPGSLIDAVRCASHETLLALLLLGSAIGVTMTAPFSSTDRFYWCLLLTVFSLPHLAALAMSMLGALAEVRRPQATRQLDDAVTDVRGG